MPAEAYISSNAWDEAMEMLWILWNRDARNTVIKEGGIKIMNDGALVGTVGMIGETVGLGYQYDGAVTSAAAVAAIHKANLAAHATDLASQLGSINYLNEQKNLHAATLASHGSTLSSHSGSISWLNNEVSSQAGSILSVASALGSTNGRVGTLESQMSGVQSGLSSAQGALSSLQSAVGGQAGTNSGFQSAINNLVSDYGLLAARISRLESWARNGGGPGGPPFNDGA